MYLSPEGLTAVSGSPDLANLTLRGLDSQLISLKRQVGPEKRKGHVGVGGQWAAGSYVLGTVEVLRGEDVAGARTASALSLRLLGNLVFFAGPFKETGLICDERGRSPL